jgi:probable phosphoglycerate mutase
LTANGEKQVCSASRIVVGPGKIVDPSKLAHIFMSPRTRARRTYELLFDDTTRRNLDNRVEITEDIREWEYGLYEGLLPGDIKEGRKKRGLDGERPWDIWLDGCEGGESPAEMTKRLDSLVARIKEIQKPCMHGEKGADVVVIAHGHSLRAFAKRWVGFELGMRLPMMLEPGAVGLLSYEHHRVDEPAFLLGVNMGLGEMGDEKEQV